jgi:hypothetical protein
MIEEERTALREDPTHEARYWHGELEKIERMRSAYLDQQAEGLVSMSELKGKLATLDERRAVAERELERLTHHQERIAELERDAEGLVELYRRQAREGLDLCTPQDRHDAYKGLGIKVIAYPDGSIELTGTLLADPRSDNMGAMPSKTNHEDSQGILFLPVWALGNPRQLYQVSQTRLISVNCHLHRDVWVDFSNEGNKVGFGPFYEFPVGEVVHPLAEGISKRDVCEAQAPAHLQTPGQLVEEPNDLPIAQIIE